ncbi:MAG: APC family permease [Candidatus Dadabacteria bacterium]|nr:MAG: APC family permease [Candidatus Dadabacteria bacterium]
MFKVVREGRGKNQKLKRGTVSNPSSHKEKLGEWYATAICGNDISSSCLYVSALALLYAGPKAPLVLILVAALLYMYRGIYAEVVSALPLNGGAYNALLNTTSKYRASIAACFTILSYLATAVISASEAIHYFYNFVENQTGFVAQQVGYTFPFLGHISVVELSVVGLLAFFALLTYLGISESAKAALAIFIFHLTSLSLLVIFSGLAVWKQGTDIFFSNLSSPPPTPNSNPLFFGFCVSLLGISGFESSANFVEEQKPGVFTKTLRNMWAVVSFFNPLLCFLALVLIPLPEVAEHKRTLLAHLGQISSGSFLANLISVDAAIVLSGAVLTSYVGIVGLVHRMTLDRCLPQFLLKKSRRGTYYLIIGSFLILCSLLVFIARDVEHLAGVYTLSFLSVMALFAFGNMLLKVKRSRLPREYKVSWPVLILAFSLVVVGIIGQALISTEYVEIFLWYAIPAIAIVSIMLYRTTLLKIGIYIVQRLNQELGNLNEKLTKSMKEALDEINSQTVVFFTRGDNLANLNEAMLYVRENEHTNKIKVVTVVRDPREIPEGLAKDLEFLDRAYPEIDIEFVVQEGNFTPELLQELSKKWRIPLNFMFIGSPGDHFPHRLSDLGGVRLII